MYKTQQVIYLSGGCFWGVEAYISRLKGVNQTEVGYANGKTHDPTYESVCTGKTGHSECVKVTYNPEEFMVDNHYTDRPCGCPIIAELEVDECTE